MLLRVRLLRKCPSARHGHGTDIPTLVRIGHARHRSNHDGRPSPLTADAGPTSHAGPSRPRARTRGIPPRSDRSGSPHSQWQGGQVARSPASGGRRGWIVTRRRAAGAAEIRSSNGSHCGSVGTHLVIATVYVADVRRTGFRRRHFGRSDGIPVRRVYLGRMGGRDSDAVSLLRWKLLRWLLGARRMLSQRRFRVALWRQVRLVVLTRRGVR